MRRTENRFRSWSCVRRVRKMLALVRLGDFFRAAHERSSTAIGGSLRRSSASNAGWVAHPLRGDPTRAFVPRGKCLIYNGLLTAAPSNSERYQHSQMPHIWRCWDLRGAAGETTCRRNYLKYLGLLLAERVGFELDRVFGDRPILENPRETIVLSFRAIHPKRWGCPQISPTSSDL